jgi:GntR family transcriptional regulator
MKIEKTVDRTSKQKLYVQMYTIFLEKCKDGQWPSGSQIPSEDELCRIYGVSKVTIREAIQELVREGYLKRRQGKGTFVIDSSSHSGIVVRTRLSEEDMYGGKEARGKREILTRSIRVAPEEVRRFLMTDEGVHYVCIRNVMNDEAYCEEMFIPAHILPGFQRENISHKSFYDILEKKGTKKISRVLQTVELTRTENDTSAVLRIEKGAPALLIRRMFIGADETPIAYATIVGNGRPNCFQMEFEKFS